MERWLSCRKPDDWIQVSKGHSLLFAKHTVPWAFCFSFFLVVFGEYSEFSCFLGRNECLGSESHEQ